MKSSRVPVAVVAGWVTGAGLLACATPGLVTYDRFDERSHTYVNDTAGFALTFGHGWRVLTDAGPARSVGALPMPTATEITLKAVSQGVGVQMETTRVPKGIRLKDLQPAMLGMEAEALTQWRYRQVELRERMAHGIPYMQWVYLLQSPDVDRTVVEALFLRGPYAVRLRALVNSSDYEGAKDRIEALMGSLTAVGEAVAPFSSDQAE